MPHKIGTIMIVAGHEQYFKFASVSIPAFLQANGEATCLHVITDQPDAIEPYLRYGNIEIINYYAAVKSISIAYNSILRRQRVGYYDRWTWRTECQFFNMIPILGQKLLAERYEYVMKVDCDSFFVGNIIKLFEAELEPSYDFYLVERVDQRMILRKNRLPGAGFYMWPTQSEAAFPKQYAHHFADNEQVTISRRAGGLWKEIKTKIISNPALHVTYPFQANPAFSKADAEVFGPAYFHLTGLEAYENQLKMQGWFYA